MNKIPQSFAEGNGDMLTYSETSAFWAFNFVANFCYLRYNVMIEDVKKAQHELESKFIKETAEVDKTASALLKTDRNKAIAYLTNYSLKAGDNTFNRWKELGHYLLIKYIDGNIKKEKDGKFLYNGYNQAASPLQPGYPESWKKKVVEETGDKLKVSGDAH
jgi:dipeptidase